MMRNRIRDLFDPGFKIRDGKFGSGIREKHPGSATLPLAYMRKGFLIYEEMRTIYEAVSHI
jgi:hypothetical protein